MICKLHPKYKAVRPPTSKKHGCVCGEVWRRKTGKQWYVGSPPRNTHTPILLKFKQVPNGKVHEGEFVWSDAEQAFVEVQEDGIGLYPEDNWLIMAWARKRGKP